MKSNLNVTVSVIKNAPDNTQFLRVIHTNICFCPLANIDATLTSTVINCDTPDGSTKRARYRYTVYIAEQRFRIVCSTEY